MIRPDGVMFQLKHKARSSSWSVYADYGLSQCSTNCPTPDKQLMKDLSSTYTLSYKEDLSYYLGIFVKHNRSQEVSSIVQGTYTDLCLKRFSMDDCDSPKCLGSRRDLLTV